MSKVRKYQRFISKNQMREVEKIENPRGDIYIAEGARCRYDEFDQTTPHKTGYAIIRGKKTLCQLLFFPLGTTREQRLNETRVAARRTAKKWRDFETEMMREPGIQEIVRNG